MAKREVLLKEQVTAMQNILRDVFYAGVEEGVRRERHRATKMRQINEMRHPKAAPTLIHLKGTK